MKEIYRRALGVTLARVILAVPQVGNPARLIKSVSSLTTASVTGVHSSPRVRVVSGVLAMMLWIKAMGLSTALFMMRQATTSPRGVSSDVRGISTKRPAVLSEAAWPL